jgi:predicted GTPase
LLDPSDDSTSPEIKGQLQARLKKQVQKARALVNGSEPITDIVTPLTTIANARTAHGLLGVDQLHSALREAIPNCNASMVQVRVWPQFESNSNVSKEVSMSWWLSSPIQRHLHQQTEGVMDGNQNQTHLQTIWTLIRTIASDCTATQ